MGARQSKRSVDITTTPKKDGVPAEGSIAGDAAAPGDGKLERIEETDGKPTTNGTGPHADSVIDDKDKDKEQEKEKDKEQEKEKDKDDDNEKEDVKVEDTRPESNTETATAEGEEVTTPTDAASPMSPETATSPDSKDAKKKDKKKKWSFRSLSFGKRDRSKTAREDAPKNGDVTKEEPLPEGGEEVEPAVPVEESPAEEKTEVSSPSVESTPAPVAAPVKEEEKPAVAAPVSAPTPVEEKKEEPTPAPTPVLPVEEKKKEEIENVEIALVVAEKVEVSPVQAISSSSSSVGVNRAQPIATPSIIERKTSEDLPPPLPSSPPPTPIDPSPLQQAQHTAANASALAEALKVPAEAASMASQIAAKDPISDAVQSVEQTIVTNVVTESRDIGEKIITSESISVTSNEIVTRVEESVESIEELEGVKESKILPEIVKSKESIETVLSPAENKILETESKEIIIENGVSGQDPVSTDNLVSLTENVESFIEQEKTEICRNGDLVIDSEEGPVPLSEESLVEAKPALIVPEHSFVDSVIKAVETINLEGDSPKTVDVVFDKILVTESDSKTLRPDQESVQSDKPEISSVEVNQQQSDTVEDLVPPPLPESPIPSLEISQGIGELLSEEMSTLNESLISSKTNDITGQLIDSEVVFDPIEELRACHIPAKDTLQELSSSVVTEVFNVSVSSNLVEKPSSQNNDDALPEFQSCPKLPAKDVSDLLDDLPLPPNEIYTSNEEVLICPLNPAKELITNPKINPILQATTDSEYVIENGTPVKDSSSIKISNDNLVSPNLPNPSPSNISITPKESSELSQLIEDQSNQEFEVESLSQSLNSYNDSDVQLKERLAESEGNMMMMMNGVDNSTSCPLLNAVPTDVPDNAQKIAEQEPAAAPADNQAEISTTESAVEAPASPAPQVPAEIPILQPSEPAITEDVASVTKAIEETDISDKAVAAAVNETIESANTNEIVTDSHHQNVINE